MFRALVAAFVLSCPHILQAADLPPPMSEENRVALVAKWRTGYDSAITKVKEDIADAKVLSKNKSTASEGKVKLEAANKLLAAMTKNPPLYGGGGFSTVHEGEKGQVGPLAQSTLGVAEVNGDGVIVEGVAIKKRAISLNPLVMAEDKIVVRYLIASPLRGANKGGKLNLDGLWYVAGEVEHNEKKLPVLYQFEIKKDEMPAKK